MAHKDPSTTYSGKKLEISNLLKIFLKVISLQIA